MDVHIVRQPIFDIHTRLFAYELLLCQSPAMRPDGPSGDRTATGLLSTAFLTEGIEIIAGNKPCFIRFTANLLIKDLAASFPKHTIIIEIPGNVPPSPEMLAACRSLSRQGFILALADFVYARELLPLIELANIVKIDCQLADAATIERTRDRLSRCNLKFLAEKVETHEELARVRTQGFNYVQGAFFARPESLRLTELPSNKLHLLRLLAEVNRPEVSVDRLEHIVAADVAITYKLLRYVNSAFFSLLRQVASVRQAIVYLGERELRRFVTLVILSELAADKPAELVRLSAVRGRFCELLGRECGREDTAELFFLGLFSLIDALLDAPMAQLMDKLPLGAGIKEALVHRQGPLVPFLDAAIAYEQGRTEACLHALARLRIHAGTIYALYLDAITFAQFLD